ncbi:MFS transporter [Hydromonas duriensis]|uniref:Putative MFS family arabinose efflux permease n=1 Tax=Hydromonas duriensis TaxID=1527608 RepID=A0A4R6YBP5_9BURK|nr:MFS transporter [Hydromonas duriensis]TDR33029.1 putative MFS family arabinose efflux permease [Hydromonas duriensis]
MPHHVPTQTHWARIFLLWCCGLTASMQFAKVAVVFKDFLTAYAVTPAELGWCLSIVGMVGLIFGVAAGLFAHALGFRRLLLVGLGLGAVLSILQTFMLPYPLFFMTRMLEGLSHLIIIVIAPILITACSAPQHRSITMGLWSTFFGAGFVVASIFAPVLVHQFGVHGVLVVHACLISAMWLAVFVTLHADETEEAAAHLPKLSVLLRQHKEVYSHLNTMMPGLCFMCYTATSVSLMTFIPQFAGEDSLWLAPLLPLMSMLGTFSAGWLAQSWFTPIRLSTWAFTLVALTGAVFWLCLVLGVRVAPAALVLMFLGGVSGGSAFALIPYLSHARQFQVRANGALAQLANMGSTIGPPIFASVITALNIHGLMLPLIVFALIGIFISISAGRTLHHHV